MCDTIVALGNSTRDGSVLFAKNSDRDANEAHEVVLIARQKHPAGSTVKCTYIEIPQAEETYQVLLCKPFWIWGAEMGANEFGVTIGNEAVFTRIPYGKTPGLIGMDFLRLALERATNADEALEVITTLLEEHGQSGNCGFAHPMFYHNSYLICDKEKAWVLETAGKEWAAEKVVDIRSISNAITIGSHWDKASTTLVSSAVEKGWCKSVKDFDFARCYSEPVYTRFSDARNRQVYTTNALRGQKGNLTPESMMAMLRSHSVELAQEWRPDLGISGADVCMHSGWGPIRLSQTTGSLVTHLTNGQTTHWVTATAAPCTSIFKPVWMDAVLPGMGTSPTGKFDPEALFWQHELVHRQILEDYTERIPLIRQEQAEIERSYYEGVLKLSKSSPGERQAFSLDCFKRAAALEKKWAEVIHKQPVQRKNRFLYASAWKKVNQAAGFPA